MKNNYNTLEFNDKDYSLIITFLRVATPFILNIIDTPPLFILY